MYRYHKELLSSPADTTTHVAADHVVEGSISLVDHGTFEAFQDDEEIPSSSTFKEPSVIGAEFILKTRDGKKLTQVTTNGILEDSTLLVQNTVQIIERRVLETMKSRAVDDIVSEVQGLFCDESLRNPFHGLQTQYQQEKFIQNNFNYVASFLFIIISIIIITIVNMTV